jgi:fimbrial chaperone protein
MLADARWRRSLLEGFMLAGALGCQVIAQAAGLSISPVVIEIDAPRKAVAVTVTNDSDRVLTLQSDARVWGQIDGRDSFAPTDDLLVVPAIAEVPAHGSQVFRVALRRPAPSQMERSYRLILEDISDELSPPGGASVAFKFVHNLPILVAPSAKAIDAVRWKPCTAPASAAPAQPVPEACVRLVNAGNRRLKVQTVTLIGDGWQQALSLQTGANLLAGAEREWHVALQAGQSGPLRSVQVKTAQGQTLQAEAGGS